MIVALLAETAGQHAGDAAAEPAFPPFDPWHWPSQAFWLVVTFAALYVILSRAILPKFAATIERRGNRIANDLDEAANLNEQAVEANKALELELAGARARARATAAEAQAEMEQERSEETARIEARLERQMDEATQRIDALRADAMTRVEDVAADAAQAMTERFGIRVDAGKALAAVKAAMQDR